jgi:hypothetical protein
VQAACRKRLVRVARPAVRDLRNPLTLGLVGAGMRVLVFALAGCCLAGGRIAAQVVLETDPASPVRGSLIRVTVTPTVDAPVDTVEGVLAGEPMHFEREDGLAWSALAGVPIEGGDSVPVVLALWHDGVADTVHSRFAVSRGEYEVDQLRVAPRMAHPDSAARARIARENAAARRVGRSSHETARQWREPFVLPRPSRITSSFGNAREFNGRVLSRHMGTDFAGALGDPIHAVNRGRVAMVANFYLAGKVIYVDHGQGLISAYFHLSRALVKPGDEVARDQVIGAVGRSGRVTGPHLHFVMRYGTTSVDPMSVMALLGRTEPTE